MTASALDPLSVNLFAKKKKKEKKRCLSVGSELLNLRGTQLFPAKRTKKKKE